MATAVAAALDISSAEGRAADDLSSPDSEIVGAAQGGLDLTPR